MGFSARAFGEPVTLAADLYPYFHHFNRGFEKTKTTRADSNGKFGVAGYLALEWQGADRISLVTSIQPQDPNLLGEASGSYRISKSAAIKMGRLPLLYGIEPEGSLVASVYEQYHHPFRNRDQSTNLPYFLLFREGAAMVYQGSSFTGSWSVYSDVEVSENPAAYRSKAPKQPAQLFTAGHQGNSFAVHQNVLLFDLNSGTASYTNLLIRNELWKFGLKGVVDRRKIAVGANNRALHQTLHQIELTGSYGNFETGVAVFWVNQPKEFRGIKEGHNRHGSIPDDNARRFRLRYSHSFDESFEIFGEGVRTDGQFQDESSGSYQKIQNDLLVGGRFSR